MANTCLTAEMQSQFDPVGPQATCPDPARIRRSTRNASATREQRGSDSLWTTGTNGGPQQVLYRISRCRCDDDVLSKPGGLILCSARCSGCDSGNPHRVRPGAGRRHSSQEPQRRIAQSKRRSAWADAIVDDRSGIGCDRRRVPRGSAAKARHLRPGGAIERRSAELRGQQPSLDAHRFHHVDQRIILGPGVMLTALIIDLKSPNLSFRWT